MKQILILISLMFLSSCSIVNEFFSVEAPVSEKEKAVLYAGNDFTGDAQTNSFSPDA